MSPTYFFINIFYAIMRMSLKAGRHFVLLINYADEPWPAFHWLPHCNAAKLNVACSKFVCSRSTSSLRHRRLLSSVLLSLNPPARNPSHSKLVCFKIHYGLLIFFYIENVSIYQNYCVSYALWQVNENLCFQKVVDLLVQNV